MQKILICRNGFILSRAGIEWLAANGNAKAVAKLQQKSNDESLEMEGDSLDLKRDNVIWSQMLEALGSTCHRSSSRLEITEIEDGMEWNITGHGSIEWVIQFEPTETVETKEPANAEASK